MSNLRDDDDVYYYDDYNYYDDDDDNNEKGPSPLIMRLIMGEQQVGILQGVPPTSSQDLREN